MIFNGRKVHVFCSKGFLLVAAFLIYLDGQGVVFALAAACLIHEAGHWITIKICGGCVDSICLTAVGAEMKLNSGISLSYGKEILISLAGPLSNLAFAVVFLKHEGFFFGGICLCLGILNMVPVYPLDGGRILMCILMSVLPRYAESVTKWVSVVFVGALLGLGYAAWRGWGNLTLLYTAFWLMIGVVKT